jgi:hypothetical protein
MVKRCSRCVYVQLIDRLYDDILGLFDPITDRTT